MTERKPWHYDAIEGRPDWAKELGRQAVMARQRGNMQRRRNGAGASNEQAAPHDPE